MLKSMFADREVAMNDLKGLLSITKDVIDQAWQEGRKEVATFVDFNLIPMSGIQYELWQKQKKNSEMGLWCPVTEWKTI